MTTNSHLDRPAYHEAGHVVAAATFGFPVDRVTIGLTSLVPPPPSRRTDLAWLIWVTEHAVVAAAGVAAEQVWWDGPDGRAALERAPALCARVRAASGAGDDKAIAAFAELAAEMGSGDAGEWIARRRAEAEAVVAVYGMRIGQVAAALVQARELDGAVLAELLAA